MSEKFIITGYDSSYDPQINFYVGLKIDREKRILTIGGKTRFQTEMEEILYNIVGVESEIKWKQTQKNKIKFQYCYPKSFMVSKFIFNLEDNGYQVKKGVKSLERIMC